MLPSDSSRINGVQVFLIANSNGSQLESYSCFCEFFFFFCSVKILFAVERNWIDDSVECFFSVFNCTKVWSASSWLNGEKNEAVKLKKKKKLKSGKSIDGEFEWVFAKWNENKSRSSGTNKNQADVKRYWIFLCTFEKIANPLI